MNQSLYAISLHDCNIDMVELIDINNRLINQKSSHHELLFWDIKIDLARLVLRHLWKCDELRVHIEQKLLNTFLECPAPNLILYKKSLSNKGN